MNLYCAPSFSVLTQVSTPVVASVVHIPACAGLATTNPVASNAVLPNAAINERNFNVLFIINLPLEAHQQRLLDACMLKRLLDQLQNLWCKEHEFHQLVLGR